MRWYIPSWNGDVRLVPFKLETSKTQMIIEKPTLAEQQQINALGEEFFKRGWLPDPWETFVAKSGIFQPSKWEFLINASLEQIGPVVVGVMRPGPSVLTAIKLEDGKMITASGSEANLQEALDTAYRSPAPKEPDHPAPAEPLPDPPKDEKPAEAAPEPEKKPAVLSKPEAAATVKRHTPCCPSCIPGSIEPAREVLLAFLNEEEHKTWAKGRYIVVTGGLSGCRYLIAHRHTEIAQENKRICYDLDTDCVVHFHDWSVPPEEEVLAAKLIMEYREPWLRNEATMFMAPRRKGDTMIFKNPFGDGGDGVPDSNLVHQIGSAMQAFLSFFQ